MSAYALVHSYGITLLKHSPIPSKVFGPPKGIIADMKQWVREYAARGEGRQSDQGCWYSTVIEPVVAANPQPRSLSLPPAIFSGAEIRQQPEIFTACIPEARVIMRTGLVISPDDRIFDQSCCWGREWFYPSDIECNTLRPLLRPTRLRGSYLTIISRTWNNYYHWFSECLTRLCVAEALPEVPILVPRNLAPFQKETLALLGFGQERLLELDEGCYEVDQLYFPSFPGTTVGFMSNWAFRSLRKAFCHGSVTKGKRLYVSRARVAHRRITNEDEIIRALEREGFTSVDGQRLTVAEQIRLYADAEIIVGVHGAGLTNILFAPAGALVIEILDPEHIVGCYYALATSLNQNYWCLLGENESVNQGRPPRKGYDDITVSLDLLLETLRAALSDRDDSSDSLPGSADTVDKCQATNVPA